MHCGILKLSMDVLQICRNKFNITMDDATPSAAERTLSWILCRRVHTILFLLNNRTLIVIRTMIIPESTAMFGKRYRIPSPRQRTVRNPSIDQYVSVNLLICWMKSGMSETGNHDPPIADMERMRIVLNPFACSEVFTIEAINIPNDVAAPADKKITMHRLITWE